MAYQPSSAANRRPNKKFVMAEKRLGFNGGRAKSQALRHIDPPKPSSLPGCSGCGTSTQVSWDSTESWEYTDRVYTTTTQTAATSLCLAETWIDKETLQIWITYHGLYPRLGNRKGAVLTRNPDLPDKQRPGMWRTRQPARVDGLKSTRSGHRDYRRTRRLFPPTFAMTFKHLLCGLLLVRLVEHHHPSNPPSAAETCAGDAGGDGAGGDGAGGSLNISCFLQPFSVPQSRAKGSLPETREGSRRHGCYRLSKWRDSGPSTRGIPAWLGLGKLVLPMSIVEGVPSNSGR
ncbi:hypothetical protein IF1G_08037 [Cordyceps javanica]|uniref:Uncharacterized protein n=1 Tax=Cordyceps javanica TaxID=43265 RepID=A0A545UVG3_9HYPO|nr:hypothetical protein IF1G_08037 [Cordyceps javanica]